MPKSWESPNKRFLHHHRDGYSEITKNLFSLSTKTEPPFKPIKHQLNELSKIASLLIFLYYFFLSLTLTACVVVSSLARSTTPASASVMATMESLIGLVNRIQTACTVLGDHGGGDGSALPTLWEQLPSIAVVGGQVCSFSLSLSLLALALALSLYCLCYWAEREFERRVPASHRCWRALSAAIFFREDQVRVYMPFGILYSPSWLLILRFCAVWMLRKESAIV